MAGFLDFFSLQSSNTLILRVCVMEHSKTQALVMEPPHILFVKKEFWKYYEKQENINHISELILYPVL